MRDEDRINHARDRRAPSGVLQVLEEFPGRQFASTVGIVHGINTPKDADIFKKLRKIPGPGEKFNYRQGRL